MDWLCANPNTYQIARDTNAICVAHYHTVSIAYYYPYGVPIADAMIM